MAFSDALKKINGSLMSNSWDFYVITVGSYSVHSEREICKAL